MEQHAMSKGAKADAVDAGEPREARCGAPNPFDDWLKRELGKLYSDDMAAPLPQEMADLANRLNALLVAEAGHEKTPGKTDEPDND